MSINIKKCFSTLLVLVIAAVTGLSVGKIYVDNIVPETVVNATEETLREKESVVDALVEKSKKMSPTSFSAVEAYLVAERNLNLKSDFYKVITGLVLAPMGVRQQMKGERLKRGNTLVYNKLSPSTSSLSPSICSCIIYDASKPNEIQIFPKGSFASTSPEIIGNFEGLTPQIYSEEKYKSTFNTSASTVLPYIISSTTCSDATTTAPKANDDGSYSFKISVDGQSLALAGLCYSYEIKFSSGMADPPKWVSMTMDVKIDADFNFLEIAYVESYKMNVSGIGLMQVTDEFVDKFSYNNLPEIGEVLWWKK